MLAKSNLPGMEKLVERREQLTARIEAEQRKAAFSLGLEREDGQGQGAGMQEDGRPRCELRSNKDRDDDTASEDNDWRLKGPPRKYSEGNGRDDDKSRSAERGGGGRSSSMGAQPQGTRFSMPVDMEGAVGGTFRGRR